MSLSMSRRSAASPRSACTTATIEVKTTLTSDAAKEAQENIASVRNLDVIQDSFMLPESAGGGLNFVSYNPMPPVGLVFAYNSDARTFETFKNWFLPDKPEDTAQCPSLVGCLDQGLVTFGVLEPQLGMSLRGQLFPVPISHDTGQFLFVSPDNAAIESFVYNGIAYPVKILQKEKKPILIDQSRILLAFILHLSAILCVKRINPQIDFSQHYAAQAMNVVIPI
jgi:hypothetical protein